MHTIVARTPSSGPSRGHVDQRSCSSVGSLDRGPGSPQKITDTDPRRPAEYLGRQLRAQCAIRQGRRPAQGTVSRNKLRYLTTTLHTLLPRTAYSAISTLPLSTFIARPRRSTDLPRMAGAWPAKYVLMDGSKPEVRGSLRMDSIISGARPRALTRRSPPSRVDADRARSSPAPTSERLW